jgi:HlyD family secretion protein
MRVAAAHASEKRLSQSLARETLLATKGVSTRAVVEDLEQQLANAKATRQSLQQDLAALRKGARSSEIDGAVARAEAARRSVMLGDERIARHQLAAPLGGTVLDVHGEMGEVIAAGTPIITLGDVARPYVDVFVPVGDLERIAVGDKAQVRVDSDDHWFDAHVDWVARTTEFTPRYLFSERERPNLVVRVRLIIDEPDARIHAGVPAFARLGSPS